MPDVIVIGGSFAGLAAAIILGRARRSVTVLDTGLPRNRFAAEAHGLLAQDGRAPSAILADARQQIDIYPTVLRRDGKAVSAEKRDSGFAVTLASGETLEASRLILAYGVIDQVPALPGFAECWGRSLIHCPYCHGYEFADRRIGAWLRPGHELIMARLYREWTDDLTVFTNGVPLDAATSEGIAALGAPIVTQKITGLRHGDGHLRAVELDGAPAIELDALLAPPPVQPATSIAEQLGCDMEDNPLGSNIRIDATGRTSVPGVFAAGDVAHARHSLTFALNGGSVAGIACHHELVVERWA